MIWNRFFAFLFISLCIFSNVKIFAVKNSALSLCTYHESESRITSLTSVQDHEPENTNDSENDNANELDEEICSEDALLSLSPELSFFEIKKSYLTTPFAGIDTEYSSSTPPPKA